MTDSQLPPLANAPEARSPTGEILDANSTTPAATTTATSESTTNEPATPAEPKPATESVPDKYEFKTPKGEQLQSPLVDSFTPIFKELNLTQSQADKLVAAYNKHAESEATVAQQAIAKMGQDWEAATRADPEMGPKLDQIKTEIGRALEQTLSPTEREAFQKSMNITMAGNNPDFVRAFWKLAQKIGPGQHVPGTGPSTAGQNPKGNPSARPSFGAALYPNLANTRS